MQRPVRLRYIILCVVFILATILLITVIVFKTTPRGFIEEYMFPKPLSTWEVLQRCRKSGKSCEEEQRAYLRTNPMPYE